MKKLLSLLFVFSLSLAAFGQFPGGTCSKTCAAIPVDNFAIGSWSGAANTGIIQWADPTSNYSCNNYHNPAITGYNITVWQDGVKWYEAYVANGETTPIGFNPTGNYLRFFPTSSGHNYSGQICSACVTGGVQECSVVKAYSTASVAPVVPAGTTTTGGKKKK